MAHSARLRIRFQLVVLKKGGDYEDLRFFGRGEPMYFPTGAKRASPIRLAKARLARLKQKILGHDPQL